MTCRHGPGDTNCSSHRSYIPEIPIPATPDAMNFSIEDALQVGTHLVMKVRYPNCSNCSFEGTKIMVYLNKTYLDALKWKKIDPHFTDPSTKLQTHTQASSPAARFPGNQLGWEDAIAYAHSKRHEKK